MEHKELYKEGCNKQDTIIFKMCLQKHQCAISPPIINLQKCMVTDFIFAPCDINKYQLQWLLIT